MQIARRLAGIGGWFGSRSDPGGHELLPSPDEYARFDRQFELFERKIEYLEKENQRLKNEVGEEQKRSKAQQERARDDERKTILKMLQAGFADFARANEYVNKLSPEERAELLGNPWTHGVFLALNNTNQALAAAGMKRFAVKPGSPFDSAWHNPINYENSKEYPAGVVLRTVEYGYIMKIQREGKFVRELLSPAQVIISLGS